jgi:hypothetical protein
MPLADTLLRLAGDPRLYLPKWTDQIMAEVSRNLQENFGLTPEQAAYRENEIRKHFGEAWVEGYEDLIPSMTNHEKDRHVLAAAVRCGAETIVTYNLGDFPRPALAPYSIAAQGPSTLLKNLYELDPDAVLRTLEQQAAAIDKSFDYLLERLRVNISAICSDAHAAEMTEAERWSRIGVTKTLESSSSSSCSWLLSYVSACACISCAHPS